MKEKAFGKTLEILAERRKKLQDQIVRAQEIEGILEKLRVEPSVGITNFPVWAKFEVHFQCYSPSHKAVTVIGSSLNKSYEHAVALWKERNGTSVQTGAACVFISDGSIRMVISPVDAAEIASNEKCDTFHPDLFKYDDRLLEEVGKAFWGVDEQLPGWHSAKPVVLEDEQKKLVPA